jgi:hypothetical protein
VKFQPNRDYSSNDEVQTPLPLAKKLVEHFEPSDRILVPCCGLGNIHQYLDDAAWCEITRGRDFFDWSEHVDWIITNPPWSKLRPFLKHALSVADHVVFLITINHLWTKARLRDLKTAAFGIREICLVKMPKSFPQSGFQLGAIYFMRGW